jgi:uncharacterized protein (TIGR03546 family)
MFKLIRKTVKLLRGGAAPRQIFLGAFLGVLVGMIPGMNLALVAGIFLLLVLNAHVGIALMGVALGKLLCLLLAPVSFRIGYTLIHGIGQEGLFRALTGMPVLALLDLHKYCLVGGLPIALFLGGVFGWVMVKSVKWLRIGIVEATRRTPKAEKLAQNKLVRLFMRIVFGPSKADLADMLQKKPPLFRKAGLILAAVVAAITLGLEFLLLDMALKAGITSGISAATGAEVNLKDAHLSLLDGKLELKGLQVTNPEKPTHNLFQAELILADLSVTDLLAKRFVIDTVSASELRTGTERSSPGKLLRKPREEREEPEAAEEPQDSLARYFEKAVTLRKYLGKLKRYLEQRKAKKEEAVAREAEKERLLDLAANQGYLALSAQRILARHPTWLVRSLSVDRLAFKEDLPPQKLEAKELSSHPELHTKAMELRLSPAAGGEPTAALELHFEKPEEPHQLQLNLQDIPVGDTIKLSPEAPVDVKEARADIRAQGTFSLQKVDIPFALSVKDLKASPREGKPVLGLDPKTAEEVFQSLEELEISGALEGRLPIPRLKLDQKQILSSLKDALVKAGKRELAKRADEQLQKVREEVTEKVREEVKERLPDLKEEVKKLLPGLGQEKKEEEEKEEQKPKKPTDLLKELF